MRLGSLHQQVALRGDPRLPTNALAKLSDKWRFPDVETAIDDVLNHADGESGQFPAFTDPLIHTRRSI